MFKIAEQYYEFNIIPQAERYYNEDSAWGVYFFSTKDDIPELKEFNEDPLSQNSSVGKGCTLTGKMQKLYIGAEYTVKAKLEYSQKYKSYNYIPTIITANVPQTEGQQELFLQSLVTSIQAKTIIEKYPNIINEVINNTDNIDVSQLKGIGKTTWENIREKILDNYVISDILSLLQPLGVTYNLIKKLLINESNPSLLKQKLIDNPYIMTEIKGLGFKKVDDLAMKLNPDMRISKQRVYAFIKYYLEEQGNNNGHTWVFETDLNNAVRDNVNECYSIFEEIVEIEKRNGFFLKYEDGKIGLSKYYKVEYNTYDILKTLNSYKKSWNVDVEKAIKESENQQGFKFTEEQKKVIEKSTEENVIIISGLAGCVDCDTEFFNGCEWKPISNYKIGEKVLQYNKDGTAELVLPIDYIKQPSKKLWHFETKYGLDQCLSDNHNCYYITSKGNLYNKTFKEIRENHNKNGFLGKFITTFDYCGNGINLSDNMIRLMVAIFADGSFNYNLKPTADTYNQCRFHLKKERKKERLEKLLNQLNIIFKKKKSAVDGYDDYYCNVPFRCKHFPSEWYNCTKNQFKIITEEVMLWDGYYKKNNGFSTSSKSDADFIQFAYSSLGYRTTILKDDRLGEEYKINNKKYLRKSTYYSVSYTKRNLVGMCSDNRPDHIKTKIEEYTTRDGYEYCFTVPSHILVLRRNNKIFITGNCGKTTISRAILNTYKNYSIGCAALSAKAAQRITEATGFPASTIHRLLGWDSKGFIYNYENPLPYDVILIDECSMISANVFYALVSAIKEGCKIIMCGDNGQLPPIGYGNIYNDLLEKHDDFCINKLTKILRQAEKSGIITDSIKIRQGINPLDKPEIKVVNGELQDMTYMFRENREGIRDLAIKTYLKSIEKTGLDETVIVVPRKMNCDNSTFEINRIIQDELIDKSVQGINYGVLTYRIGAKVIQRANNYDKNVFNGEIGYIKDIWKEKNSQMFSVEFRLGNNTKMVTFSQGDLENIDLAYALTCHLSQGSGYKNVVVIIDNTHYSLLDSCLLYTAITRAKQKCLLIAEPTAFNRCLKENKTKARQTWLSII